VTAQRILQLEELTAHQAKAIDELSAEVAAQGELLRRMQKRLEMLSERFLSLEESVAAPAEAKRPPHW
jgi:SlyX protein